MTIPKQLKICGYNYEVILEDRKYKRGTDTAASCNSGQQKIWIDTNQCQEEQESSLIHEVLEAFNYHFEFGFDHKVISTLETSLYQVLKDNGLIK